MMIQQAYWSSSVAVHHVVLMNAFAWLLLLLPGDVLLHTVTDAILGALCLPDIGEHGEGRGLQLWIQAQAQMQVQIQVPLLQ
jgi:2C-methyl-D-erythritol 2,4-cyclodiphosphate synthase